MPTKEQMETDQARAAFEAQLQEKVREAVETPAPPERIRIDEDYENYQIRLSYGRQTLHLSVEQARKLAFGLRRAANRMQNESVRRRENKNSNQKTHKTKRGHRGNHGQENRSAEMQTGQGDAQSNAKPV